MTSRAVPCRGGNSGHGAACSGSKAERSPRGGRESLNGETNVDPRRTVFGPTPRAEHGDRTGSANSNSSDTNNNINNNNERSRCFIVGLWNRSRSIHPRVRQRTRRAVTHKTTTSHKSCERGGVRCAVVLRTIEMQSNRPSLTKHEDSAVY